jgi:hypothetical protein
MPIEVIDGRSLSSRAVTHETTTLDFAIGSHTSKVIFYQCHFFFEKSYHH